MLQPTRELFEMARGKDVRLTFFIDVGYLIQAEKYPDLREELKKVKAQIQEMLAFGHDVQLHIHPHWEKSRWQNGKWTFNTWQYYKLSDFPKKESDEIVRKYKLYLDELIDRETTTFRAGGWCIQPFDHLRDVFEEVGIKYDSTVIPGDYLQTHSYAVDFREAPFKSNYSFNSDPVIEEQGPFKEYPIGSLRYSPLFYWRLYILGRLFPKRHKMIGDGKFLSQGGRKKMVLLNYSVGHVSSDGYFAGKLEAALEKYENLKFEDLVVIGHPKGNTKYSMEKLTQFVANNHKKHNFTSFEKLP